MFHEVGPIKATMHFPIGLKKIVRVPTPFGIFHGIARLWCVDLAPQAEAQPQPQPQPQVPESESKTVVKANAKEVEVEVLEELPKPPKPNGNDPKSKKNKLKLRKRMVSRVGELGENPLESI